MNKSDDHIVCGLYAAWYRHGHLHREGAPAVIWHKGHLNGQKEWWNDGYRHRIDGPAIECSNGLFVWYLNLWVHSLDLETWLQHTPISIEQKVLLKLRYW